MDAIKRIVIVGDEQAELDGALRKAAIVEHATEAEVEVVQTTYSALSADPTSGIPDQERHRLTERLKDAERYALSKVVEPYKDKIETLTCRIVWSKNPAEDLAAAAQESKADLLIKPMSRHNPLTDFIHTPLDWALMRDAPCPVLITKERPWAQAPRILAAVDAGDFNHEDLNKTILVAAQSLADALAGTLNIVSVYPGLSPHTNEYQTVDLGAAKAQMHQSREQAIDKWTQELGLNLTSVYLSEGDPGPVIAAMADDFDVVVIGTAARTGVRKLLVGNTAESIVARVKSDLLAVREAQ